MTTKKLMMAATILAGTTLSATTACLAQGYYGGPYGQGYQGYYGGPYGQGYQGYYGGPYGQGYYDYAPGAGVGLYDYGGGVPYNYGPAIPDVDRGGPGPRVQAGSGMGIGAVR